MYVNLVDLQLIEIGAGSMLGDEVQVGCHLIQGNHIYLKKVVIGENSFIGINSKLGPGTKIGDNCMVGPWNFLLRHKIKDNTELEPFTYFQKNS
jgi:acetyltransferase-like isoleucine patch superfamily enzyme